MDILGLQLPTSFFQHSEQQQSLETNDLTTKFPVSAGGSRPMKNAKEITWGIKSRKHYINRSSKKPSGVLDDLSRHSSATDEPSGEVSTSSNGNELVTGNCGKKNKKKKKKPKKKKPSKMCIHSGSASEVGDMDNQIIPYTQSCSRKVPPSAGLIVRNSYMTMVPNQDSEEVISKSLHDMDGAKHNNARSGRVEWTYVQKTGDVEQRPSIRNSSSDVAVLQDPDSGYKKGDKTFDTKFSVNEHRNAEAVRKSTLITPVSECNPMAALLEDLRYWETKSMSSDVDLIESLEDNHIRTEKCQERSNLAIARRDKFSVAHNEIMVERDDQKTGKEIEGYRSRSQLKESRASTTKLLISMGAQETYDREVRSSNHSTRVIKHPAPVLKKHMGAAGVKSDSTQDVSTRNQCYAPIDSCVAESFQISNPGMGNAHISNNKQWIPIHMNNKKKFGKENNHFVGQKIRWNFGNLQTHFREKSDYNHLGMEVALPEEAASFKNFCEGDDSRPHFAHSSNNCSQQIADNLGICYQKNNKMHRHILVESSEWDGEESLHTRHGQFALSSREESSMENRTSGRSKHKAKYPLKQEKFWVSKEDLYTAGIRPNLSCRDALGIMRTEYIGRINFAGKTGSSCKHYDHKKAEYCEGNEVEYTPYVSPRSSCIQLQEMRRQASGQQKALLATIRNDKIDTAFAETVAGKSFHVPLAYDDKSSVFCNLERPCDNNMESFTCRSNMWIPVGKKPSTIMKASQDSDTMKIREEECQQEMQEVRRDACKGAFSIVNVIRDEHKHNGMLNDERENHLGENQCDIVSASDHISKKSPLYIGSKLALRALDASYRVQIACEDVQLARGCPIAEFEKLLSVAAPVITPIIRRNCEDETITASFSKFQKSNILLQDVWCWYEKPGNYGLEVNAKDSQNSKLVETKIPFCAHFVPSLSAIQLFGYSHVSGSSQANSTNAEQFLCLSSSPDVSRSSGPVLEAKNMKPCVPAASDGSSSSNIASSLCSTDATRMIFEYFEHEPPQLRKPLFSKIKELLEDGASNPHVFGDISNLKLVTLQDLHPASWFSVAWYPIYRIPEGHLRASFLTYHSFGHLFPRDIKSNSAEENTFCFVLPVLGMQSYNAQGECWFNPKEEAEPLLKDGKPVDISALLKERLTTLEEAAALFARGTVRKGHITAPNRQPDYEFFVSRKK